MLSKSFFSVFFFFNFIFFTLILSTNIYLGKDLLIFPSKTMSSLDFSFLLDFESMYFLFMVLMVTSMVLLYGEFYMEHYNNKKFFYLTLMFLTSMIFLSMSGSLIILMVGWDGLGISSLFLIMFYPGKIPLFNSFMTFFYNRLGDCFMILVLCLMIFSSSYFLQVIQNYYYSPLIMFFLCLCSLTKSAQFPLSSWLPAAMSAPTPISAMVHSSTLVTAGIFIFYKFFFYMELNGMLIMISLISGLTFLSGGMLGCLELDLKKIVAFSTMSQISMIILFCCSGMLIISMNHMIFHALFKTLLFCSCGVAFSWVFSDQLSKMFSWFSNSLTFLYIIFLSIFCMSGFPFSSSFFSKDMYLESSLGYMMSVLFFTVIIGSIFTILYSSKIMSLLFSSYTNNSSLTTNKMNFFYFMIFFSICTIMSPHICKLFIPMEDFPVVGLQDVLFISFFLIMSLIMFLKNLNKLMYMSLELFFSKFFIFGNLSNLFLLDKLSIHFNDQLMFKPASFMNLEKYEKFSMNSIMVFLIFLFSFFLWF